MTAPPPAYDLSDDQLLRYSRHILLDDIGTPGQERLLRSHALVIGAGGLGSPAALYLGTAGVGTITIVDDDTVELANLQRQIAHSVASIGQPKAVSAAERIGAINPDVRLHARQERAGRARLDGLVGAADVVLDCSDNFATRQAVNEACVAHGKPLVSGAAIGFDGQVSVFDSRGLTSAASSLEAGAVTTERASNAPSAESGPCYACIYPPDTPIEEASCATMGVFAPLVGIIGSVQAAEALKLLLGIGRGLAGRLQMLDARRMEWTEIRARRDPGCPVCGPAGESSAQPRP